MKDPMAYLRVLLYKAAHLSTTALNHSPPTFRMCFRRLENTRHSCGHDITHGDHLVDCGSSACRYSSKHQANYHDCKNTCKQWLRPPQNVVTQTSGGPCYHCPALRN